jgi:hypothetical protein
MASNASAVITVPDIDLFGSVLADAGACAGVGVGVGAVVVAGAGAGAGLAVGPEAFFFCCFPFGAIFLVLST